MEMSQRFCHHHEDVQHTCLNSNIQIHSNTKNEHNIKQTVMNTFVVWFLKVIQEIQIRQAEMESPIFLILFNFQTSVAIVWISSPVALIRSKINPIRRSICHMHFSNLIFGITYTLISHTTCTTLGDYLYDGQDGMFSAMG